MAYPVPTKDFLQPSPEAATLYPPFRCTHPPPHVAPNLLTQNVSPKDITENDITNSKSDNFN